MIFLDDVKEGGEVVFPLAKKPSSEHPLGSAATDFAAAALHGMAAATSAASGVELDPTAHPKFLRSQAGKQPFGRMGLSTERACARRGAVKVTPRAGTAVVLFNHHPNLAIDPQAVWGICPQPLMRHAKHSVLLLRYTWAEFNTGVRRGGEVTKQNDIAKLLDACHVSDSDAAAKGLPRGGSAATMHSWSASLFHAEGTGQEQEDAAQQLAAQVRSNGPMLPQ